ncbi:MAG: hypothetical protein O2816_01655 [Planctomycetota bacterium]|nr:hypothetical protein [Planctomycetota bacterium]
MMNRTKLTGALAGLALAAAVIAVPPARQDPLENDATIPASADPTAVWDVLYARPFRVAQPFKHWWRLERPMVTTGHLVVLSVDPQLFIPRQSAEPVLQIGLQTAERVNSGHFDGALVIIVPSEADGEGWPVRDLALEPMFLGSPALPEEVDALHLASELAATTATAFARARIDRALALGGAPLDLVDREALNREAGRLIQRYAPGEPERAAGLLGR